MTLFSVPPQSLDTALAQVKAGRRLVVRTHTRCTVIDAKTLAKWEATGQWLVKAEGDGYRLRTGNTSVYLFPGQLEQEG